MSQSTDTQFGWLQEKSTKDLINLKFFYSCEGNLFMRDMCEKEIDARIRENILIAAVLTP